MNRTPNTRRGFTLVELLVVVLILAILMAVALPLYLNAIKNSEKGTARANMQTIANAEQSYKLAKDDHTYTTALTDLKDINVNGVTADADVIKGPGDRTYNVTKGPGKCKDANNVDQDIPDGGIAVHTAGTNAGDANDGCFIPGVTPN